MLNLIQIDKRVVEVSTLEVEISTVLGDCNVGSMEGWKRKPPLTDSPKANGGKLGW